MSPSSSSGRPAASHFISGMLGGLAGKAVGGPDDLLAAIQDKKPWDRIEIEYYRRQDRRKAELELSDRPAGGQSRQESPGLLIP